MYTHVRPSGESVTNIADLLWTEVRQSWSRPRKPGFVPRSRYFFFNPKRPVGPVLVTLQESKHQGRKTFV